MRPTRLCPPFALPVPTVAPQRQRRFRVLFFGYLRSRLCPSRRAFRHWTRRCLFVRESHRFWVRGLHCLYRRCNTVSRICLKVELVNVCSLMFALVAAVVNHTWISGISPGLSGIAVDDANGNIFVANSFSSLVKITPAGQRTNSFITGLTENYVGMVIDPVTGTLYVSDGVGTPNKICTASARSGGM